MANTIHRGEPLLAAGEPVAAARGAVILLHGRGASAASIMTLVPELATPGLAFLAPQATNGSWYPFSFLMPLERNEPFLSAALATVGELLAQLAAAGIPAERVALLGFSQGACLASEFVARNARRYGGLIAFSGGLIGPDGTPRDYPGNLAGTPVFLGCSDFDSHIPQARVRETEEVLRRLGGAVTTRLYPAMGHTVNADEIVQARAILAGIAG